MKILYVSNDGSATANFSENSGNSDTGILSKLDKSVGQVVESLRKKGMLRNSIIIFSTDNGGPAAGFNLNAASNWPLRGVKNTLWEGMIHQYHCLYIEQ